MHTTQGICAFRQWRADIVIQYMVMHSFEFVFGGEELDERNWIVDFGGLKLLKEWLDYV